MEKSDLRQGRTSVDSEAMRTFLGAEGTHAFLETANRRDCIFLANTFIALYEMVEKQSTQQHLGFFSKEQSSIQVSNFLYPSHFVRDINQNSLTFCVQTIHNSDAEQNL